MSANSYLEKLAREGLIRSLERVNIRKSLLILRRRINKHFSDAESNAAALKDHFAFGSFTRGTMLPRGMDPQSDVDYMVVFTDLGAKPQAYLDRLRRFAEGYYGTWEIAQSHPTIILSMNHIRFELVPAIETLWSGIQIPSKDSLFSEWMTTVPDKLNSTVMAKNKRNDSLIKPLIRLVKYWNACNRYPFESFDLEKAICAHWTFSVSLFGGNLWTRFVAFLNELSVDCSTEYQKASVERAQKLIADVKELESNNLPDQAGKKLRRLLPEVRPC